MSRDVFFDASWKVIKNFDSKIKGNFLELEYVSQK